MTQIIEAEKPATGGETSNEFLHGLVGYRLARASGTFLADFRRAMEGTTIRPALFAMLSTISENPAINQTGLGKALGIQRANLVPLVNELLERDLIERQPAANDRRAFALHLTDAGVAALQDCVERIRAHEDRMLAVFTRAERAQLLTLLAKISAD